MNSGADRAMNLDQTLSELTSLPVAERLRAVERLWDSMADEALSSIPPEQRAEICRRVRAHEEHADELLTWDQVLDQLRDRK
jgi:putative addiction module component (TIGR02574 family)